MMIKIDIVHNQATMFLIHDLCLKYDSYRYTSMQVDSAFDPVFGSYDSDSTDPKYYTFIITDTEKAPALLQRLKEDLGENTRLFICQSVVEQVQ